jgi:hypothetical protein
MRLYDFPEELVRYPVQFPPGTVRRGDLGLVAIADGLARPAAFQLLDAVEREGFLEKAVVAFRTDLPKGATRKFQLVAKAPLGERPGTDCIALEPGAEEEEAILAADELQVKVPRLRRQFLGGKPLCRVPAPLLAVCRKGAPWPNIK